MNSQNTSLIGIPKIPDRVGDLVPWASSASTCMAIVDIYLDESGKSTSAIRQEIWNLLVSYSRACYEQGYEPSQIRKFVAIWARDLPFVFPDSLVGLGGSLMGDYVLPIEYPDTYYQIMAEATEGVRTARDYLLEDRETVIDRLVQLYTANVFRYDKRNPPWEPGNEPWFKPEPAPDPEPVEPTTSTTSTKPFTYRKPNYR
jgi:hypothetical protein